MVAWIVFLRGINVGGKHNIAMALLKTVLLDAGCSEVKTYIQSGNILLCHPEENAAQLQSFVAKIIQHHFGFSPHVMALSVQELSHIIQENPFAEAVAEPKSLHVYFLAEAPLQPQLAILKTLQKDTEAFALKDRAFYLHAPEGIGRSKLAEKVEKCLGVAATARNWRTVNTMHNMAADWCS